MRQNEAHRHAREDAQNGYLACAHGCVFSYGGWPLNSCMLASPCSRLAIHGPRHLTTAWKLPVAHELARSLLSVFKRSAWLWISQLHAIIRAIAYNVMEYRCWRVPVAVPDCHCQWQHQWRCLRLGRRSKVATAT